MRQAPYYFLPALVVLTLVTIEPAESGDNSTIIPVISVLLGGETCPDGDADGVSACDGDCLDTDDTVFPGALESLGDAVDQDCDGDVDTTTFGFGDLLWDAPRRPVVGKSSQHYVLTTTTDLLDTQVTAYSGVGVTLLFDRVSPGFDEPYANQPILQTTTAGSTFGQGVDMLTDEGSDLMYPAASYYRAANGNTYVTTHQFEWNTLSNTYDKALAFDAAQETDTYLDLDLARSSSGETWVFACGAQTLHYLTASTSSGVWRREDAANLSNTPAGSACFLDVTVPTGVLGTVCNGVSCTTYDLNPSATAGQEIAVSASQPWSAESFTYADTRGGWLVATYPTQGVKVHKLDDGTNYDLLTSNAVYAADMMMHGTDMYLAAIVDDGGGGREVVLSYGDPAGTMDMVTFDFVESGVRTLVPESISLHVDSDRVFMAVSGPDDVMTANNAAVGWVFLGTAP